MIPESMNTIESGMKRSREQSCSHCSQLPRQRAVEVIGSDAPWLNQIYTLVPASSVLQVAQKRWPEWCVSNKGEWLWLGEKTSPKGESSLPYIWYDRQDRHWNLATIGFRTSHYVCCSLPGAFPDDLMSWLPGPEPLRMDPDFPEEFRQAAWEIRVIAREGGDVPAVAPWEDSEHTQYPRLREDVQLDPKDASFFLENGYLVKRAHELGTHDLADSALRASNIIIREAAEGCGGVQGEIVDLRDCVRYPHDSDFGVYTDILRASPTLWTLISRMLGREPAAPHRCQVAILCPTGLPGESYKDVEDRQSGIDYHIDGRGMIPNNFTLLVGISLCDQPLDACSWGGLTVFPGSQVNSELHQVYPSQKFGHVEKLHLGKGVQIRLQKGDVILAHSLLAHRRAENWSAEIRHMLYFRLRPAWVTEDWEAELPAKPFANLPGVVRAAAARVLTGGG